MLKLLFKCYLTFLLQNGEHFSGYDQESVCQIYITNFTNFSSFCKNLISPDLLTLILFFAKGLQNYKNFEKVFAITGI